MRGSPLHVANLRGAPFAWRTCFVNRLLLILVLFGAAGCEQAECLTHCNDHREQVCGDDERTYLNACRANCTGTTVDYAGPCQGDEPEEQ